jgi:predicted restriction endonuclease
MKIKFTGNEEEVKLEERCLEIYTGNYSPERQYAASILLHMLLKDEYGKFLELVKEVTGFKVNNRGSGRVVTWSKKVKRAGKCEVCGATENLDAHHIIPWSCSITGRADLKNGQCLCKDCHKMMHNDVLWIEYMQKKG